MGEIERVLEVGWDGGFRGEAGEGEGSAVSQKGE